MDAISFICGELRCNLSWILLSYCTHSLSGKINVKFRIEKHAHPKLKLVAGAQRCFETCKNKHELKYFLKNMYKNPCLFQRLKAV